MSAFGIDIDEQAICLFEPHTTKDQALEQLVQTIVRVGRVSEPGALRSAVLQREAVMSTGIGNGVAIPHVRIDAVQEPAVCVGISRGGIEFGANDNKPVHVLVFFAMPSSANKLYLTLLAQVMVALRDPAFVKALENAHSVTEAMAILNGEAVGAVG